MEKWQFLIQKQGDRSWHALESPNTEIMEGRYRVLALSHLPNTDVEVRITHFSPQEIPPKRRILRRLRRTNAEGLMAVLPFTYLKAGVWELRCAGDLMSDMLGQSWQYGVYLQVASESTYVPSVEPEREILNDAHFLADSSVGSNGVKELAIASQNPLLATGIDPEGLSDESVSPVWVKGESAEQILQNLIDLALPTVDPLAEDIKVEPSLPPQPPCPLVLTLDRETYITRWGHVLTIHGKVELKDNNQADELQPEKFSDWELRIELRSPQSLAVLTQVRQSLAKPSLPFTVRSTIDIPAECESQLILADIGVYGSVAAAGEKRLLAHQSFTITADVTQLLAVTTTPASSPETSTPDDSTSEPSVSLDLELFNLVKTPPALTSQPTPVSNTPIPESIATTAVKKAVDSRGLKLPKLPENLAETPAVEPVVEPTLDIPDEEQDETTVPITPAPINLEQLVIKNRRASSFPYLKRREIVSTASAAIDTEIAEPSDISINTEIAEPSDSSTNTEIAEPSDISTNTEIAEPSDIPNSENLPAIDLQTPEVTPEIAEDETLPIDESLELPAVVATSELAADSELDTSPELPEPEFSDDAVQTAANIPVSYSSPLIRKWMQSQGYSLPEIIEPPPPPPDVIEPPMLELRSPEPDAIESPIIDEPVSLPTVDDETASEEISVVLTPDITESENLAVQEWEESEPEPELTDLPAVAELPPVEVVETSLSWLDQEFVVDDFISDEPLKPVSLVENRATASLSIFTSLSEELIEPLPTPQLHVPEGELIAGNSVRVRVELPKVAPSVVVKLWVEDCQTRWLLDGPHMLTDLLPNSAGGLEVMLPLNIPFGCLEIRIEAIALNRATQQESHKATVLRTVIPPDLPNLALDELLGL